MDREQLINGIVNLLNDLDDSKLLYIFHLIKSLFDL